jgi:hypothetical protein
MLRGRGLRSSSKSSSVRLSYKNVGMKDSSILSKKMAGLFGGKTVKFSG